MIQDKTDLWGSHFGNHKTLSIRELIKDIEKAEQSSSTSESSLVDLGRVLQGITKSQTLNSRSLGWWFRRNSTVVVNGRQFVLSGASRDKSYRLVKIKGGEDPDEGGLEFWFDLKS